MNIKCMIDKTYYNSKPTGTDIGTIQNRLKATDITIKKGFLHTNINLAELSEVFLMPINLPTDGFELLANFNEQIQYLPRGNHNFTQPLDAFSITLTYKNSFVYSTVKN